MIFLTCSCRCVSWKIHVVLIWLPVVFVLIFQRWRSPGTSFSVAYAAVLYHRVLEPEGISAVMSTLPRSPDSYCGVCPLFPFSFTGTRVGDDVKGQLLILPRALWYVVPFPIFLQPQSSKARALFSAQAYWQDKSWHSDRSGEVTRYPGPEVLCRLPLQAPTQVLYVIYSLAPLAIGFVLSLKS